MIRSRERPYGSLGGTIALSMTSDQILDGLAVHTSVPSHLPFPLAVDKYPYL